MTRDPELQALLDKQACTEVVYRVARAIDRCDPELLSECFHPDATDDHGLFKGAARDFAAFVMPMLRTMVRTQHAICNILIEVDGDHGRGESYFIAQHTVHQPDIGMSEMFAAGRYLDTFARKDGAWRLSHRHAIYDWNTTEVSSSGWETGPMKDVLARGARGQADASYAHFKALKS